MTQTHSDLWHTAETLAQRPYTVTIERDSLSDDQEVYIARNPELPGCKAQGFSVDEATTNLEAARLDYIHAMLEADLHIPDPTPL